LDAPDQLVGLREGLIFVGITTTAFGAWIIYLKRNPHRQQQLRNWLGSDSRSARVYRKILLILAILTTAHIVLQFIKLVTGIGR
jgi:hypothetical protein